MGVRYTGLMHAIRGTGLLCALCVLAGCSAGKPKAAVPDAEPVHDAAVALDVRSTPDAGTAVTQPSLVAGASAPAADGGGAAQDRAPEPAPAGSVAPAPAAARCERDDDCDDALFCNGAERCIDGRCKPAPQALRPCPDRACDESQQRCNECTDRDGDSYVVLGCPSNGAPTDCDDTRAGVSPRAAEICGDPRAGADSAERDEDCNPGTCFRRDRSGQPLDGDGDPDRDGVVSVLCVNLDPWTGLAAASGADCDDDDPKMNGTETCDGADNDCDGNIDEDPQTHTPGKLQTTYYADRDHDGAGDPQDWLKACSTPTDHSSNAADCNDRDPAVGPDKQELCDGKDNDCDGTVDDAPGGEPSCPGARFSCAGVSGWHISACGAATLDCDGSTSNCCEVPVGLEHCGACGKACVFSCAADSCDEPGQLGIGGDHSCTITRRGVLACWGRNDEGRLGVGDSEASARPRPVELSGPVHAVSSGAEHTCAISGAERQLFCWGSNKDGQSGYVSGPNDDSARRPQAVQDFETNGALLHVAQVSAGYRHTCAVLESGAIYCWGQQANGRLGNLVSIAGASDLPRPVQRGGASIDDALQVVTGISHSCAVLRDHTVACWGSNGVGQLGNGKQEGESTSALAVPGLSDVESLAAGPQHTCALSQGRVLCWGSNASGQLGREDAALDVPGAVPEVIDAVAITAGNGFSCALRAQGGAWCWGSNDSGERGDGSMQSSATPSRVQLDGVLEISAGYKHACARSEKGVACWGKSLFGQLGYETGTQMSSATPRRIQALDSTNR